MDELPGCKGKENYFCFIHVCLYSSQRDNLRIITECLRPTPTDHRNLYPYFQASSHLRFAE